MHGVKRLVGGVLVSPAITYGVFYAMEASHEHSICHQEAVRNLNADYCAQSVLKATNNDIENFPWPYTSVAVLGGLAIGLTPTGHGKHKS